MPKNAAALCASLILSLLAAPHAFAQDAEEKHGDHVHHGTMTTPDGSALDVMYEMSPVGDGVEGWFVVHTPDGQEFRMEMRDLSVSEEMVSYHWSAPGADIMISCELASDGEGGWAGDCIDNEDGETGQMTMGPKMEYKHDDDHHEGEGED